MLRLCCILAAGLLSLSASHARADPPTPQQAGAAVAKALATAEQRFGSADPKLLPILASLAQLRFEDADVSAATALRRRSLKIAIAAYGSASEPAAEAMAALAHLYIELRQYLDAEPLAIAADNVLSARLGAEAPALAPLLADRARIALARGEPADARKLAEAAIAIDDKNLGAPRSDRLRVLGAVLVSETKFSDSERVLRRALALDRAGGDRLATARSLAQLGKAFLRQKRFAEALPPIEEAAAIDQDRLGATHPLIAEDLHDLGLVYLATGRAADAAMAFRTAIGLLEHGAGRGTPTLAYIELDLAHAEHVLGHKDRAQSLFGAARRILNAAEDEERERQRRA
ncbi:MAG: tetratricopeptide repeat protein [Stellaceae bacterium]